jgi:hypothetical protein
MEKLPKGTLSEKREDTVDITLLPPNSTIKIADPAPTVEPTVLTDPPPTPALTIVKEPIETDSKPKQKKEPCTLCKAKSIANVAFSFSLVLLVLAFSFSLVKTDK